MHTKPHFLSHEHGGGMEVRAGYKMTEVGVIPQGWELIEFGDIAMIRNEKVLCTYTEDGTPCVELEHIGQKNGRLLGYIEASGPKAKYSFKSGDVLFGRLRAYLRKNWLATFDGICSTEIWPLISRSERIHPSYLNSLVQMSSFIDAACVSYGTHMPRSDWAVLEKFKVQLPPMPEQRAIAQALSDVDALLATLDQLIAKKRDLKQATMQQLLTGKTRLPGFGGEWEVKRLGDVVDTDPENLGSDTATDFCFNYISLEDVDRGQLRSHSEEVFIDAPSRARRKLMPNDVLVSTVRPNLQSHLLFKGDAGHWVCSTGFCVIRCREGVTCPAFVFSHFFGDDVNRQIDTLLTGSNYPAINSGDVSNLKIMFPSYIEQCAIATVLSEMDAELAALEARLDKTNSIKQAMMQELLTGKVRLV